MPKSTRGWQRRDLRHGPKWVGGEKRSFGEDLDVDDGLSFAGGRGEGGGSRREINAAGRGSPGARSRSMLGEEGEEVES